MTHRRIYRAPSIISTYLASSTGMKRTTSLQLCWRIRRAGESEDASESCELRVPSPPPPSPGMLLSDAPTPERAAGLSQILTDIRRHAPKPQPLLQKPSIYGLCGVDTNSKTCHPYYTKGQGHTASATLDEGIASY